MRSDAGTPERTAVDPTHAQRGQVGVQYKATPLSLCARGSRVPGVSSLWTPEGEHRVARDSGSEAAAPSSGQPAAGTGAPPDGGGGEEEALAAHLDELRQQLMSTPVEIVVANHAYGLFELAAIHLSQRPADLVQGRLAIDALAALVEGLAGRLGEAEASLVDALAQIRLAYVQIQAAQDQATEAAGGAGTPEAVGDPTSEAG
jgi:hypothetical protein